MSDLAGLVGLLLPFFGLVALGVLAARATGLPESGLAYLQVFIVYLALPCLFFRLISATPVGQLANARFIASTTLSTACAFAISYGIGRWRASGPDAVMSGVAGSYSNVGYMGPPLVVSLLGPEASAPVALIFVFDTLFLFTIVPAAMALCGRGAEGPWAAATLVGRRIVMHPFMIATAVGLAASLAGWQPPRPVDTAIGWLSGASAPAALFVLGVTVATRRVGRIDPAVWWLAGVKLLGHPLLAGAFLVWVGGFDRLWIQAAIVMAALPPALNVFVLARQYEAGVEVGSAAVLVGTVLSVVTLTAIIWLVTHGAGAGAF